MVSEDKVKENIQLVRELSNELAAFLHSLPDQIWRNADDYASACDGWKVADVITHLISAANLYHGSISRALKGDTSPPMGFNRPASPDERLARLIEMRDAYYEDLFYEFNASCKRLNTLMLELEPESYALSAWHPMYPVTVSRLIDFRVLELAVHAWDIKYPFDREAKLSQKAVPFLLEALRRWLRAGFRKGEPLESPVRYCFSLSDSESKGYDVIVSGNDFSLVPCEGKEAEVTFHCDTNTYILFGMGRMPFSRSVRRGRIKLEGDEKLAAQFTEWFGPI
jgi:uncharacterized protein (TIGR03083 family)